MPTPNRITKEVAGRNALYAMLACNCYHDKEKRQFPVDRLDWYLVDQDGERTDKPTKQGWLTGFAYDIYEHSKSNKSVLAFRGSDGKNDWLLANGAIPFSIPYKSAVKAVRTYLERNPPRDLTVIGHSLGGGLALSASVHHGVRAITFDPSPRIFDGLGDYHQPAARIIIYQHAEILASLREKFIKKAYDVVREEDIYECDYDFAGEDAHRIDILATEMAKHGLSSNAELGKVLSAMP